MAIHERDLLGVVALVKLERELPGPRLVAAEEGSGFRVDGFGCRINGLEFGV